MQQLFTGIEITATLIELGVSHVVWLPDSELGLWEESLETSSELQLIRVCREGEAWAVAAGLKIGGRSPIVVMQTTGLFESGDSMRNVLFDLNLPIFAIVGARSWLVEGSTDSAKLFTASNLHGWNLSYQIIAGPKDKYKLAEHYGHCARTLTPGVALIPEGSM